MSIFSEIEQVRQTLEGWCTPRKSEALAAIIIGYNPRISCELGVWGGGSAIPMAMAHKHLGFGMVIAIDPWSAAASIDGEEHPKNIEFWGNQRSHDLVYEGFLKKRTELGLQNVLNVIRAKSDDAEPPENIGLLHIDGNHGPQAIRDVQRYAPNVSLGGFLVMDDTKWSSGCPEKAMRLLPDMGFVELYRLENGNDSWAVLQRISK